MRRLVLYVLACVAVASAAGADTVRLANGKRFDNVLAEVQGDEVAIRFSYGEMRLPARMVAAVETAESSLGRYLARSEGLSADREATAEDWLDLALEARAAGLEDGYRRALLRAAALDPNWPPLAVPLRALDYVLDDARGRWLPYEESSAGLAAAAAREEARRAAAADAEARVRAGESARLREALELALLAEVTEDLVTKRRQPPPSQGIPLWGYGPTVVTAYPGWASGSSHGWRDDRANRETLRELSRRQPGSLLPVRPPAPRHNRSTFKSPGDG